MTKELEELKGGGNTFEIPSLAVDRLRLVIDYSWKLLFAKIVNEKLIINKEASMQLQLGKVMQDIGSAFCVLPNEVFDIELETSRENANIDITCKLGEATAAIELKCFRKSSNRPGDLERYDCFKDIVRLESLSEFDVKVFICLTDNPYYINTNHSGKAAMFTTKEGTVYAKDIEIIPGWVGQWKDTSRDQSIVLKSDLYCNWEKEKDWFYWLVNR